MRHDVRRRSFLISLLFLGWVLSSAGSAAAGSQPGSALPESLEGSTVYWSQFVDLDFSAARIVAANPHGRHFRVLTHPATGVYDIDPKVSPDGSRILFQRDLADTSVIGIVGADGRGERVLDLRFTDPCVGVGTQRGHRTDDTSFTPEALGRSTRSTVRSDRESYGGQISTVAIRCACQSQASTVRSRTTTPPSHPMSTSCSYG